MESSLLYYWPSMEALARRIEAQDLGIELATCYWNEFGDAWPDIRMPKVNGIRRKNVAFLMSMETPAELFAQLSMAYALSARGAQDYKIILPYYPTGTLERGDSEGHVVTAKTLARMLSAVPLCRSGPVEIVLYDIHTLAQRNYFGDNINTRYKTGTKYLKQQLEEEDDVAIAFPDHGAYKRFQFAFDGNRKKLMDEIRRIRQLAARFDRDVDEAQIAELEAKIGKDDREFPMIVCEKVRGYGEDADKRFVHVKEGNPEGMHVVIVDDLIRTGGTIIECKNALVQAGAAKVSAYATHGVFPNDSWMRFIGEGFHKVWITDSIPSTAAKVAQQSPFEVLSLDASIARVIAEYQQW